MDLILSQPFLTSLITGLVISGVPLLLAGLGEQMSEKAGVLNIGIEGMMLTGAYVGFLGAYPGRSGSGSSTGSPEVRRWRWSWRCCACGWGSARSLSASA
jgi:ABC-type uncharacterized transport system permease subunit